MSGSSRRLLIRGVLMALLMAFSALLAVAFTPRTRMADRLPRLDLARALPMAFGDWSVDTQSPQRLVDPGQAAVLDKIYSQLLNRSYVDRQGHRMMVSIAYGEDQRDEMALHYPEVCYPAQGFAITAQVDAELRIAGRAMAARQLVAEQGGLRTEPLTYWTVVGHEVIRGKTARKLAQIRYGLQGRIPDGLLFRVSSIGWDAPVQFRAQEAFVQALLAAMAPADRVRFTGGGD